MSDRCDLYNGCEESLYHHGMCTPLIGYRPVIPHNPWDEISPGLWQGSSIMKPFAEEFDAVFTLYKRAPAVEVNVKHAQWIIPDAELPNLEHLADASEWVRGQWMAGRRVLVRCQAGLNRSGLVVARVLLDSGAKVDETIHLIRQRRSPFALCNPQFETYLRSCA